MDLTKCIGFCTDGARSMSGSFEELQALIRIKASDALWTHKISTCIKISESCAEPSIRIFSKCGQIYKNSSTEVEIIQKIM